MSQRALSSIDGNAFAGRQSLAPSASKRMSVMPGAIVAAPPTVSRQNAVPVANTRRQTLVSAAGTRRQTVGNGNQANRRGSTHANQKTGSSDAPTPTSRIEYPIQDKHWINESIEKIVSYVVERNYSHDISLRMMQQPSFRDFINVTQFLSYQLDPNLDISTKPEEDIAMLLQELKYPYKINKSTIKGVLTPMAWPPILASVRWLVELLNYAEIASSKIAKVASASQSSSASSLSANERFFFDYVSRAYISFLTYGEGHTQQTEADLQQQFVATNQQILTEIHLLSSQIEELKLDNERLTEKRSALPELKKKKIKLQTEMEQQQRAVTEWELAAEKAAAFLQKLQQKIEIRTKYLEGAEAELQDVQKALEAQPLSPEKVEELRKDIRDVERKLETATSIRKDSQKLLNEDEQLMLTKAEFIDCRLDCYTQQAVGLQLLRPRPRTTLTPAISNSGNTNTTIALDSLLEDDLPTSTTMMLDETGEHNHNTGTGTAHQRDLTLDSTTNTTGFSQQQQQQQQRKMFVPGKMAKGFDYQLSFSVVESSNEPSTSSSSSGSRLLQALQVGIEATEPSSDGNVSAMAGVSTGGNGLSIKNIIGVDLRSEIKPLIAQLKMSLHQKYITTEEEKIVLRSQCEQNEIELVGKRSEISTLQRRMDGVERLRDKLRDEVSREMENGPTEIQKIQLEAEKIRRTTESDIEKAEQDLELIQQQLKEVTEDHEQQLKKLSDHLCGQLSQIMNYRTYLADQVSMLHTVFDQELESQRHASTSLATTLEKSM